MVDSPVAETWTPLRLLDWTAERFAKDGVDSPRLDAQVLLAHAMSCDRVTLYTQFDKPLGAPELDRYRELVKRRLSGEPVAYLVGRQEFWSLDLEVDARVLIPRRDTETVIECVLDQLGDRQVELLVADVATGAGPIALALAAELPRARVIATDVSADAAAVARQNAERLGYGDRVEVRTGDLLGPLADVRGKLDVLVSNPPYIPSKDIEGLSAEVRAEPRSALDGGPDGLIALRSLCGQAADYLGPGGLLAVEHGFDQGAAVRDLIDATGAFEPAATRADLGGNPRVSWARTRS